MHCSQTSLLVVVQDDTHKWAGCQGHCLVTRGRGRLPESLSSDKGGGAGCQGHCLVTRGRGRLPESLSSDKGGGRLPESLSSDKGGGGQAARVTVQ